MSLQPSDGRADGETARFTICPVESIERVRHANDTLSSFSHSCRNTLNGIKLSFYFLTREDGGPIPECVGELERSYRQIEALFDRLQMLYRPLSLTLVRAPLGRFFDGQLSSWRSQFNFRGRTLDICPPANDLPGDFDPMLMEKGLEEFIAWRADASPPHARAVLSWRIEDSCLELRWAEQQPENGFRTRRGEIGSARTFDLNGKVESLAHLLLKRIIRAHGGFLELGDDPTFVMTLCWPRLRATEPANFGAASG